MIRKLLLSGLALSMLTAGVGAWWYGQQRPKVLDLPGVVEIQEVRLSSKVGGRVERVAVREGDHLQAGQPLVFLEAPELQAQLQQADARLQAAQADLDKARNGPRLEEKENARAAVAAAEARWQKLKAGFRSEEIEQAEADLNSAVAELEGSRRDWDRVSRLVGRQVVTREEADSVQSNLGKLRGRVDSARAKLKLLRAGNRPEEISEAAAELKRNQASLDLLLAGTRSEEIASAQARVAELEARVEELKVNLQETVIKAPEAVVVEVLAVRKGDVLAPNQSVARVLRAEDLWIKVYIPETELGRVRLGQEVAVTIDSYPGQRFTGSISQIASASEFTPRNVQSADERKHQVFAVKVRVPDPQGIFKSGMAATALVPLRD